MKRARILNLIAVCSIIIGPANYVLSAAETNTNASDDTFSANYSATYVDNAMADIDLAQYMDQTGINKFVLSFITYDENGAPSWGGYADEQVGLNDKYIDEIRDNGGDIILSFGGANASNVPDATNADLAATNKSAEELADLYEQILKQYDAQIIDFDIEGLLVQDAKSLEKRAQAVAILEQSYADQNLPLEVMVTLPVLETGLTNDGINVLQTFRKNGATIDTVNIMTMDYGHAVGDMGGAAIEAGESLKQQLAIVYPEYTEEQLYQMIGITPMIGQNDSPNELFTLEDQQQVVDWAQEKDIRFLSFWSTNRDNPGPDNQVSPSHSGISNIKSGDFGRGYSEFTTTDPYEPPARDEVAPSDVKNLTGSFSSEPYGNKLSWDAATDDSGYVQYQVYRNDQVIATTKDTSYLDKRMDPNEVSKYYVRAIDASGNQSVNKSNEVVIDEYQLPAEWVATKDYPKGEVVLYNDNIYIAKYYINAGKTPDVNDQSGALSGWELIAGNAVGAIGEWQNYVPYPGGSTVTYEENTYTARYYISSGVKPDVNDQAGTKTGWGLTAGPAFGQIPEWQNYLSYTGGTTVDYNGTLWTAKWYTSVGEEPGVSPVWVAA